MASETPSSYPTIVNEITTAQGTFVRVYSDGTITRPLQSLLVPPTLHDPQTGLCSKDITISHNPLISARIYLPKLAAGDKVPILVYFHGGGFLIESAFSTTYDGYFKTFAPEANVIVVSVEYRLAPEHPLPACYHDSWSALKWVCSHNNISTEKQSSETEPWLISHGDFNRVFIGGDSSGGNIAHNVAMGAGKEDLPGGVRILGAFLTQPFFFSSYPVGSEPVTERKQRPSYRVWDMVYPSAAGGIDNPVINPVGPRAPSLAQLGCSSMIVCVAGQDRMRDRGVWYCECVKQSGWQGNLELFEEEDEDHAYHLFKPESEAADKLMKRLASFLHQ